MRAALVAVVAHNHRCVAGSTPAPATNVQFLGQKTGLFTTQMPVPHTDVSVEKHVLAVWWNCSPHSRKGVCNAGECSGETPECMVSNLEKPWK